MARRIVSYTPAGAYVFRNLRHTPENYPLVLMDVGERTTVFFDLEKYLDEDEMIIATEVRSHGINPKLAIEENAVSVTASEITNTAGHAELIFETSQGERINTRLYVRDRSTYWQDRYHRELRP